MDSVGESRSTGMGGFRNPGAATGHQNRQRVRAWFQAHLCGTQRECAEALDLSVMAVNRHVAAIRGEWREPVRAVETSEERMP